VVEELDHDAELAAFGRDHAHGDAAVVGERNGAEEAHAAKAAVENDLLAIEKDGGWGIGRGAAQRGRETERQLARIEPQKRARAVAGLPCGRVAVHSASPPRLTLGVGGFHGTPALQAGLSRHFEFE